MKVKYLDRSSPNNETLVLRKHSGKSFKELWHYHPELELGIILEGSGSLFVGDSIHHFKPGTIVLIGKNLPHVWYNDKVYTDPASELTVKSYTIHFNESFVEMLVQIPEMSEIQQLLQRVEQGLLFFMSPNSFITRQIEDLFEIEGYDRIMAFLNILNLLSRSTNYSLMSSLGYINSFQRIQDTKLSAVHEYIMNHFKEDISLATIARIANMNASSFSRYFSSIQKKTLTQFINEIRIGYACKLMISGNHNITQACYESGFRNLSNFNRHFLKQKKMLPSQYLKLYKVSGVI